MNVWLIIAVTHTTKAAVKLNPEKKFRPERDSNPSTSFPGLFPELCDTGAVLYQLSYQAI